MLTSLGQSLRNLLAEEGYEFTPDELEESIIDSVQLKQDQRICDESNG